MSSNTLNVVVFGGAGFIGRALCKRLSDNAAFYCISADNDIIHAEGPSTADENRYCDVRNASQIHEVLMRHRPDYIFWLPARQGYKNDHSGFSNVQVTGIYALFEAIDVLMGYKPEKIILSSSQAIYTPAFEVREYEGTSPPSVYGLSKLQQEEAFFWFCQKRQIAATALRYSIVLGGGQAMQSSESGLLRNWFRAWQKDESAEIYGDGQQRRDFVHLEDVVTANMLALKYDGIEKTFNITGEALRIVDAWNIWRDATQCVGCTVLNRDVRPGGEYTLTSNGGLAERELNFKGRLNFQAMVHNFLASLDTNVIEDKPD